MEYGAGGEVCPCPNISCCNGRGLCLNGTCACQVQFSGTACESPNLFYLVSFGCVFFLLFVVATVQLVLCMIFDALRNGRPLVKNACRVTTQKLLYGVVIGASGTRGIYFAVQSYIPSEWGDILLHLYYPAMITGFSLLMCHWTGAFTPPKGSHSCSFNKYSAGCLVFNMLVYCLWLAEVISTGLVKSNLQFQKTNIFSILFAFLMMLTLLGFVFVGMKLFVQRKRRVVVNAHQQKHSLFGLISQTLLQGLAIILLMYDVTSNLYHNDLTDNVTVTIFIKLLEFGVGLWFSCTLWNIKKPDTLWVLHPELVLQNLTLRDENSRDYGTIKARPDDLCIVCREDDKSERLIFPCKCRGELGVVHPSCLLQDVAYRINKENTGHPRCRFCNYKYDLEGPSCCSMLSLPAVYKRLWIHCSVVFVVFALSLSVIYLSITYIHDVPGKLFVICVCLVTSLVIFQVVGYHWWLYYKRTKSGFLMVNGPTAILKDDNSPAVNASILEEDAPLVDNAYTDDDIASAAILESSSVVPSPSAGSDNCSQADSVSITVSVIVHSPSSIS